MIRLAFVINLLMFLCISCGSTSASYSSANSKKSGSTASATTKQQKIVKDAKKYIGTRYKYGGTTRRGMDCSGLVYTTFAENNIRLPRTSLAMSSKGKRIKLNQVKKGDLLFFRTGKSSRRINHVGVVSKVSGNKIYFVHSSTSKGVIESSLATSYWNKAFRFANRVL